MARYLNSSDYAFIIQNSQLNQILQIQPGVNIGNNYKLLKAENTAQEEVNSYLVQRWDLSYEFTATDPWSYSATYSAHDRIILDYNSFSTSASYSIGSCVIYNGYAYMSLGSSATSSTPDINTGQWTLLGEQYAIFYAKYPYPLYDSETLYQTNDVVFWQGHTFSAARGSIELSNEEALQYQRIEWLPSPNSTPGSNNNWIDSGTYSIPIHTLPTNTTYWILGDNRSQQLVMFVMDICLYHLHKNIAPTNIPLLRTKAYDDAINYLKRASRGDVTLNIPVLNPKQGLKIRFAGNVRKNNSY